MLRRAGLAAAVTVGVVVVSAATAAAASNAPAPVRSAGLIPTRLLSASWSPFALAACVFVLLLFSVGSVLRPRPSRSLSQRLAAYSEFGRRDEQQEAQGRPGQSLLSVFSRLAERVFGGLHYWKHVNTLLERADLPLRTGELFYIQVGAALLFAAPALITRQFPLITIAVFAVGFLVPLVVVRIAAKKRLKAFDTELPDVLVAMAASLKAGHSWSQATDAVAREGTGPIAKEFTRVASETRLGRPNDDAMESMATRIGSVDFGFVVTSVNIQRQVGGSLAELLDQVAETVRQRQQFRRKVKALTSMGRMSAYTLIALPFLLGLAIYALNSTYLTPLWTTSTGELLMIVGFVSIGIGAAILKKIVSFKV